MWTVPTQLLMTQPLSGPKAPVPSKVSVTMPTEDWLCKKLSKSNVILTEGYPTRSTEAGGLMKDQFLRPVKSQLSGVHFILRKRGVHQLFPVGVPMLQS